MTTTATFIRHASWPLLLRERASAQGQPEVAEVDVNAQIAALYDLYADDVFGHALWLLGSHDEAAEVVQDTFVRLLTWKNSPGEIRNPRAFLLRIGRTAALDRVRKRRPTESLPDDSLLISPNLGPEVEARSREITRALGKLPAKQREVLYLHFFLGFTFREIGRLTRVPTFTAASRCRLGLRRLEKRMTST
jgi:RNA polymerase sigma-70 factor (ECF subfamily)